MTTTQADRIRQLTARVEKLEEALRRAHLMSRGAVKSALAEAGRPGVRVKFISRY